MPSFFKLTPLQFLAISSLSLVQSILRSPPLFFLFCSTFWPVAKATMEFIILADKETGEPIGVKATSNFINQIFNHLSPDASSSSSSSDLANCNMDLINTEGIVWNNTQYLSCADDLEKINGTIYYNSTSLTQQIMAGCIQNFEQTECQNGSTKELAIGLGSGIGGGIIIIFIALFIYCCFGENIKNAIKHLCEFLQNLFNCIKQTVETCASFRILNVEPGEIQRLKASEYTL